MDKQKESITARAECGTRQAVYQHRKAGERLDEVCMAAEIERRQTGGHG
jgi:hypothetical protein